ncbi:hypothetical protein QNM97_10375 [Gordonia sp. L191]|uniref:hypothetical protein n=1 Tax=Gordonia sp. L191 TaxID=2982699 RepID=UPI0024C00004|nr:hypothetical protein [Gordonia sp. L191]WHU49339.1 hypothetical protein QNM97_10375 [Gordonia sp. L191]
MIEFNVTPARADGHHPNEDLRTRTSRWWTCADDKLRQYGDYAFAVESNLVSGVFAIPGWTRDPNAGHKVVLDLADLPAGDPLLQWIGQPPPIPWTPGQRQPFKYVTRVDVMPPVWTPPDATPRLENDPRGGLVSAFLDSGRAADVTAVKAAINESSTATPDEQAEHVIDALDNARKARQWRYSYETQNNLSQMVGMLRSGQECQ